jgi:hypothetical protein
VSVERKPRGYRPWWAWPLGLLGMLVAGALGAVAGAWFGVALCDWLGTSDNEFLPCLFEAYAGVFVGFVVGMVAARRVWVGLARHSSTGRW